MRVHNIRLGFATNSSSSHSLCAWKGSGRNPLSTSLEGTEGPNYGWSWFTLADPASKRDYLRAQYENYPGPYPYAGPEEAIERFTRIRAATVNALLGYAGESESSVDHQSRWTLPVDRRSRLPDGKFLDDLRAYLERDEVVVLGRNDNEDDPSPREPGLEDAPVAIELEGRIGVTWARKDPENGSWTLFNSDDGRKVRFSFGDAPAPKYAFLPELVDVSITDFCGYGCEFCYRGSTPDGVHAPLSYLRELATRCGEAGVFEVAIGGGEPTKHPEFDRILRAFREAGVVPNFTTRNRERKWWSMTGRSLVEAYAGAVAFSIDSASDLPDVLTIRDMIEGNRERVTVQYVVGTNASEGEFRALLEAVAETRIRLTLLGYKNSGRGRAFGERPVARWAEIVADFVEVNRYGLDIGIDTVLADSARDYLVERGLDSRCIAPTEGTFSAFVDAVKGRIYRSSYDEKDEGLPFDPSPRYSYRGPSAPSFADVWRAIRRTD